MAFKLKNLNHFRPLHCAQERPTRSKDGPRARIQSYKRRLHWAIWESGKTNNKFTSQQKRNCLCDQIRLQHSVLCRTILPIFRGRWGCRKPFPLRPLRFLKDERSRDHKEGESSPSFGNESVASSNSYPPRCNNWREEGLCRFQLMRFAMNIEKPWSKRVFKLEGNAIPENNSNFGHFQRWID